MRTALLSMSYKQNRGTGKRGPVPHLHTRIRKTFARGLTMNKLLLGLASLLLPGLGHAISGNMIVGLIWFGVWLLIFTSPIVAILSAAHYLAEA